MKDLVPAVSVITPAFNAERFLSATIRSVLSQDFQDFEYLIVDDASQDRTREVATEYSCLDDRVRVISIERSGASAARNAALRLAQGRLVAFVDADDVWLPGYLKRMVGELQQAPLECQGVFCWSRFVDVEGQDLFKRNAPLPGRYGLFAMLVGVCPPGNGSCVVLRKEAFDRSGYFDVSLVTGEDSEMWYRILSSAFSMYFLCIPETLVCYRSNPTGLSQQFSQETMDAQRENVMKYASTLNEGQGLVYLGNAYGALSRFQPGVALEWLSIAKSVQPELFEQQPKASPDILRMLSDGKLIPGDV